MSHSRSLKHRGATLLQVITNSVTVNIVFLLIKATQPSLDGSHGNSN